MRLRSLRNRVASHLCHAALLLIALMVAACKPVAATTATPLMPMPHSTAVAATSENAAPISPSDGALAMDAANNPPTTVQEREPVRLEIPSVGIDTPIEPVGLTQGSLDWADSDLAVGWFYEGFQPGEVGNTVLVGHVVTHNDGGPAGLWHLDQVHPGDEVVITLRNGERYRYVVQGKEEQEIAEVEMERTFGVAATENLNIVTHSFPDGVNGEEERVVVVYSSRAEVRAAIPRHAKHFTR